MIGLSQLRRDASLSAVVAGLIATVIAYAGPLVIIFQAAASGGLSQELLSSWVWTISIGSGVLGIVLSLRYRVPVIIAWSAPGSALLVALLPTVSFAEAIGAYLVAAAIVLLVGWSGAFDRIVARLPASIAAAMLAGILFGFGTELFVSVRAEPVLVLAMFVAYLLGRRFFPSQAVVAVLVTGVAIAAVSGRIDGGAMVLGLATPVWVTPEFNPVAIFNIALPLVVVALTGQFLPGFAVLRAAGYTTPASPIIAGCGLGSAVLAPFGCHGLNLAAITAAICTGRDAHPDPARRYVAGVSGGLLYLAVGVFGATLVSLFSAFPAELIAALAGLALFGAIAGALAGAMATPRDREAALVTLLVTASGMSLFGLSAAFWGLVFGLVAHVLLAPRTRPQADAGKGADADAATPSPPPRADTSPTQSPHPRPGTESR